MTSSEQTCAQSAQTLAKSIGRRADLGLIEGGPDRGAGSCHAARFRFVPARPAARHPTFCAAGNLAETHGRQLKPPFEMALQQAWLKRVGQDPIAGFAALLVTPD